MYGHNFAAVENQTGLEFLPATNVGNYGQLNFVLACVESSKVKEQNSKSISDNFHIGFITKHTIYINYMISCTS